MKTYSPKKFRPLSWLSMCLRGTVYVLRHWFVILIAVLVISPVGPHLRVWYTYKDYGAYKTEIDISLLDLQPPQLKINRENPGFTLSFLTRMIFSTLVDADWLETESYMQAGTRLRGGYANIENLAKELNLYLERYETPQTDINRKRTDTL